ncbi:MAG: E3 binding domain-containing protein, partial [Pseudomonadota bacterium]|nr:E3 binding domain-containing protein [Pseudomonadota bacterium]
MKVFYLPDLGEGLPEAEIREWLVKEGDHVKEDTPIVAMETAKALVDVPAPFTGIIHKFHGGPGDIIKTGDPLVSFDAEAVSAHDAPETRKDSGTVVGNIEVGEQIISENATGIKPSKASGNRIKASPAVRKLAEQLHIDLAMVTPTGPGGSITINDIKSAGDTVNQKVHAHPLPEGYTALHGVARSMAINMALAHQQVVPVTIVDDADIQHFGPDVDISVRIIRAVEAACKQEPKVNSHFHGKSTSIK